MHTMKNEPIKIAGIFTDKKFYCTSPVGCGKEITGFKDKESVNEYRLNRLCQHCQDKIFIESKK